MTTETPKPRMKWRAVVVIGLLCALGAGWTMLPKRTSQVAGPIATHVVKRGELLVTVTEQGTLESANNTEIKCKVRGDNTIISVVESGVNVEQDQELLRLDTSLIEEEISERTKFAHLADSQVARSAADVARAKLAIAEYEQGRFVSELKTLEKDLAIARSRSISAKDLLAYSKMMANSEYVSETEVEEKQFALDQAELEVDLAKTRIEVLEKFTKEETLADLRGKLNVAQATHKADVERADADRKRLERAEEELKYCVIKAERPGMVIYPRGRAWEEQPDIEEGATVHKDQVLLLMPDLTRMQVKVGIHESVVDRVAEGLEASVTVSSRRLPAKVKSVASVAKPAGWWTGNVVKYDTVVSLPADEPGLKPGMSVEVEVVLARHQDVLMAPTSAVIETPQGFACWVRVGETISRQTLQLGDHNDMFIVVKDGVAEGDVLVLDPLASVPEAQEEAAAMLELKAAETQDEF